MYNKYVFNYNCMYTKIQLYVYNYYNLEKDTFFMYFYCVQHALVNDIP